MQRPLLHDIMSLAMLIWDFSQELGGLSGRIGGAYQQQLSEPGSCNGTLGLKDCLYACWLEALGDFEM